MTTSRRKNPLRSLEMLPDRAVKRDAPEVLAVEAEKTRRAHRLGQETGLFRVPRVLHVNADCLELERLPALTSLRKVLLHSRNWRAPLVALGRSLAVIHNQLELPASMAQPLPDKWQRDGEGHATLHGDLNFENTQVDQRDGGLVILDWSVSPLLACAGTCGPPAFDLAWLARSLFFIRRPTGLFNRRVHAELDVILTSYFEHPACTLSATRAVSYFQDVSADLGDLMVAFYGRSWLRRIDVRLHMRRYDRWTRSDALRQTCEALVRSASSRNERATRA